MTTRTNQMEALGFVIRVPGADRRQVATLLEKVATMKHTTPHQLKDNQ